MVWHAAGCQRAKMNVLALGSLGVQCWDEGSGWAASRVRVSRVRVSQVRVR